MGLMGIYRELAALDEADEQVAVQEEVKVAQAEEATAEAVKLATDYDAAGRRLASALWGSAKLAGIFPFAGKGDDKEEGEETEEKEEREGKENKPKPKSKASDKEDEEKDKEKSREKEGDDEEQEEKKASILARAAEDPDFAAQLIAWHRS